MVINYESGKETKTHTHVNGNTKKKRISFIFSASTTDEWTSKTATEGNCKKKNAISKINKWKGHLHCHGKKNWMWYRKKFSQWHESNWEWNENI